MTNLNTLVTRKGAEACLKEFFEGDFKDSPAEHSPLLGAMAAQKEGWGFYFSSLR